MNEPLLIWQSSATSDLIEDYSFVGFTTINFNTARQTIRSIESLAKCECPPAVILVLDNGSIEADFNLLKENLPIFVTTQIQLYRSNINLGFAAGSNFLVAQLLKFTACDFIGLLNNDAVAKPQMVSHLRAALEPDIKKFGLSGGRMHRLLCPEEVDTLGISLYASLMPADRKTTTDVYCGPTGGCCLMARTFVQDILNVSGYLFDERFFCYCEDTDLILRANLLGYCPVYVDELVALHEGQASSGGGYNAFITYHGIRNTIWMHFKLIPRAMLLKYGPLLLLAHAMTIVQHSLRGQIGLVYRVYRDAVLQIPDMLRERKAFALNRRIDWRTLESRLTPSFYRRGYFRLVIERFFK